MSVQLLPRHAAIADKFTLLRSVAHDEMDHGFGSRRFLTGYRDDLVRGESALLVSVRGQPCLSCAG